MSPSQANTDDLRQRNLPWTVVLCIVSIAGLLLSGLFAYFFGLDPPGLAERERADARRAAENARRYASLKQALEDAAKPIEALGGRCRPAGGKGGDRELPQLFDLSDWRGRDEDLRLLRPFRRLSEEPEATFGLTMPRATSDATLSHLAELTNLRSLDLAGTQATDDGLQRLRACNGLGHLNLKGTAVTDRGMEFVRELKQLRSLDLSHTAVSDEGAGLLKGLGLFRIDVTCTRVTPAGIVELQGSVPPWKRLIVFGGGSVQRPLLQLKGAVADDDFFRGLLTGTQYERIEISGTRIGDRGLDALRGQQQLRLLWIQSSLMTEAAIENLRGLQSLRQLWLPDTAITNTGLAALAGLHDLESLALCGTGVTNAELAHLENCLQLQYLSLFGTQVSDEGLHHLKVLTQLRRLALDNAQISDVGLVHLATLNRLEHISLKGTRIHGPGLSRLRTLPSLQELWLTETQVSVASAEELQRHLPKVTIHLTSTTLRPRPVKSKR